MTPIKHRIYIGFFVVSAIAILGFLIYYGYDFYSTAIDLRFDHPQYNKLKPSGFYGHLYGIAGTLLILLGIGLYMLRKRVRFMSRLGVLKHWLEFHIWICSVGAMLILFHTSFKFGGIVAVSFWSMLAVVVSGILGRYIYLQIPRTLEGRELSLKEINKLKIDFENKLHQEYGISIDFSSIQKVQIKELKEHFNSKDLSRSDYRRAVKIIKSVNHLERRIKRLEFMQKMFRYWHVVHLPVALIMLIVMVIHVVVVWLFGYRWIF